MSKSKSQRAAIKRMYDELLHDLNGVSPPVNSPGSDPMWHLYPLRVARELWHHLQDQGIRAQVNPASTTRRINQIQQQLIDLAAAHTQGTRRANYPDNSNQAHTNTIRTP